MPDYHVQEKFAWRPILTTSGKWLWWRRYTKLMKIYWGPAGEDPVIDAEFYTQGEWLFKVLAEDYTKRSRPPKKAWGYIRWTKKYETD